MELDTDIQVAELDYRYNQKRIEFFVSASYGKVAWGADNEDEKVECYCYNQVKEANIEVTGYETPKQKETGMKQNLNIITVLLSFWKKCKKKKWKKF